MILSYFLSLTNLNATVWSVVLPDDVPGLVLDSAADDQVLGPVLVASSEAVATPGQLGTNVRDLEGQDVDQ